jgi:hypothetical protein
VHFGAPGITEDRPSENALAGPLASWDLRIASDCDLQRSKACTAMTQDRVTKSQDVVVRLHCPGGGARTSTGCWSVSIDQSGSSTGAN